MPSEAETQYGGAKDDLALYGKLVHGWEAQPHHLEWIKALAESDDDLLIVAPPGSAKTNWMIAFCGWELGHHPEDHIIYCANTASQSQKPSMALRDTIALNEAYRGIFPDVNPAPAKSWAGSEWYLKRPDVGDKDPSFVATGVFGPILGARANLIIMDDVSDEENTATHYLREKVWNWVSSSLFSRRALKCRNIAIATRWHNDDVAGHLKKMGYKVIEMPVEGYWEDGSVLWPLIYPPDVLEKAKLANPRRYQGMYMANPTPPEGAIWKSQFWRHFQETPKVHFVLQSWDTGFKEETRNDPSVCTTWGVSDAGYPLLDVFRKRLEFPQLVEACKEFYKRFRPNVVLVEDAASGQSLIQVLKQETRMPIVAVKVDKSKENRAWGVVGLAQGGRVLLPERASWLSEYVAEMEEFPNGTHDDQVDATTMSLAYLQRFGGGLSAASDVETEKRLDEDLEPTDKSIAIVSKSGMSGRHNSRWNALRKGKR